MHRKVDTLSAEEAGIDGPRSGADHSQSRCQNRLYQGSRRLTEVQGSLRDGNADLGGGCERTRYWRKPTDCENDPARDANYLKGI